MRRILAILILMLYFIPASGLSMSMHFCGDQIASVNWFGDGLECEEDQCCSESVLDDSCCSNKEVTFEGLDVQKAENSSTFLNISFYEIQEEVHFYLSTPTVSFSQLNSFAHISQVPLWVKFCALIVYH